MAITFNTFDDLNEDDTKLIRDLNEGLNRLRDQRQTEIHVTDELLKSKAAWKIATFREAVLYRLVALTESAAINWNYKNILGSYLATRAIIETSALLLEFEHDLQNYIEAKEFKAMDDLLMNRTFSTRDVSWIEISPASAAVNVLTLIDKLDRRILRGIRGHYDHMSERCHPNSLGHHMMFGKLDSQTGTTTYSETKDIEKHRDVIFGALLLVLIAEKSLLRLDDAITQTSELHRKSISRR